MKQKMILLFLFCISLVGVYSIYQKQEFYMKDIKGNSIEEVREYAKKEKLKLEIQEEYHETVEKGNVISQSIFPKTKIKKGDSLRVVISLGKLDKNAYQEKKVNELGQVPIMMYHGIHDMKNEDTNYMGGNVDEDGYQRTSEAFRNDLEKYYQEGFRMIALKDYVKGVIDVPLGYSPIVLTFDDGAQNNIKVTGIDSNGNIRIDPNSAVGILEEYKKKYPDFNVTATFFLNAELFNQPEYNDQIINWLIKNGYDIGNHTYTHPDFTKITYEKAVNEVGKMYELLEEKTNNIYVKIIALPFGSPYKKTHSNFSAVLNGNYNNMPYQTEATLQVGWDSNFSPFHSNFDSQFIKRIRAYDNNGNNFDIEDVFERLQKTKYISDGNKNQITIPESELPYCNQKPSYKVVTY